MKCNRCDGTGFLNLHQIDGRYGMDVPDIGDYESIRQWMNTHTDNDVSICDCCGDGENWYGIPGEHYNDDDPMGDNGPYAYNGGRCECH